jgi:hypothetical protein
MINGVWQPEWASTINRENDNPSLSLKTQPQLPETVLGQLPSRTTDRSLCQLSMLDLLSQHVINSLAGEGNSLLGPINLETKQPNDTAGCHHPLLISNGRDLSSKPS